MSILYAISIVYIAGEYDGPGFCTPIGILQPIVRLCIYYYRLLVLTINRIILAWRSNTVLFIIAIRGRIYYFQVRITNNNFNNYHPSMQFPYIIITLYEFF